MTSADPSDAEQALVQAACAMRATARCEYSGFAVGVAIEDERGVVHTGANVENASYNLGLCAERVALYHALTHGGAGFRRIAIAAHTDVPTYPCGACRQALWEFCRDAEILLVVGQAVAARTTIAALLPEGFDAGSLALRR